MQTFTQLLNLLVVSPYLKLVKYFESIPYGLYILIGLLLILVAVSSNVRKIKENKYALKTSGVVALFLASLILFVGYDTFMPNFFGSFKSNPSSETETKPATPTQNNTNSGTKSTPSQSAPTQQTQKQLYYSVSCSTCWNQACPHNGYSYGGWDVNYYNYYRNLCSACSCNNFRAQSLWR